MLPIPLDKLIEAISGIATPVLKNKIQRSEIVIKLLNNFNLSPEHPPSDFSGIYAYTLVEYGVNSATKEKPLLELFRQEEIKQSFRKAFDHNNPSIILSEVDAFIEAYALGDEIKSLRLDIRREIIEFYIVFSQVAKRSRAPADVLMDQAIGSLHKSIASIQEQLERLPTLEGVRTEMARLAEQNSYLALPGSDTKTENQCRAIALAEQIRGWFETLGYRFEKYEYWTENYFEWIINIPVRRNRYDRIIVRGIEGEVGLSDVVALGQSTETQRADEGWLVTTRRISKAARNEVNKEENSHLGCYTFDELLAQDADFNGYLDWLEAEVKRRKIDSQYVPLACKKEEIDPLSKNKIAVSHYDEQDGWIDGYIDRWLHDPVKEHISILGEFGTGKTWFALHYAWVTVQRYRDAQRRGIELPRLPLVIPLQDYAKAVSVESLFSEFFFRKHEIPLPGYSAFEQLNRMGKLLLIFDGFDEMAARVDKQEMINNFWELAKVVVPGAKVILTCRTEHFPEAQEGRALLNAELQASTKNLTGETPQFEVLELEKFNDDQIRQVLLHQAEVTTVQQVMSNPQLLDLARRPVMTDLILEALPDIEAGKPVDMSRVYLYAVRRKMERDIKAERTFTSLADKLYFLCELSWEMLSTEQMSLNYRLFPERIRRLFGSIVQEEKDLDHWHYDMMAQTMLVRDGDGDYTPAHRSLLEFFVAYKFAAELGVLSGDFLELAQAQSYINNVTPINYTWSSYFQRQVDETKEILHSPPLKKFLTEPLEKLRETFGKKSLTKAVIDLLVPMLDGDAQKLTINIIEATRNKNEDEVGYIGGNAATLAVKINHAALEGKDFSNTVILGADLTEASLSHINFANANLLQSIFIKNIGYIWSICLSRDGKLLAIGDSNDTVHLWEVSSGQELLVCNGNNVNWIIALAFTSDNTMLASGSNNTTIKLWNVKNGNLLKIFEGHKKAINSVSFTSDNKILASGSDDTTIRIWDTQTGQCLKVLQAHTKKVNSVCFSVSSKLLVSGSHDKTVKLWNVETGECLNVFQYHAQPVLSVAFDSKNETIISGSKDGYVKLWDISTGKCIKTLQGITAYRIDFQAEKFASCNSKKLVEIRDIKAGLSLRTIQRYGNEQLSCTCDDNRSRFAAGTEDGTIKVWDISTGLCTHTLYGHVGWVRSLVFSPLSNILFSSSDDQTVRLWDLNTEECLKVITSHTLPVRTLALNPLGTILASGSNDQTIRLWDVNTGECIRILEAHTGWINSLAFSTNSKFLASVSSDTTIRLWDVTSTECLKVFRGHNRPLQSVAFAPHSNLLASGGGSDHLIKLWNFQSDQCLQTLDGHTGRIFSIAFSSDGSILASGSSDQTVRIWNADTGECIRTLQGHHHSVLFVTFFPDDKLIVTGSSDRTMKIWNIITGECLKTLSSRPYEGMNITDIKGLTEAEKATLKTLGATALGNFRS